MNLSKMTVVGLMLKKRMILYIQLFSSDALFKNLMLPDIPSLSAALSNLTRISGIVQLIYENSSLFRCYKLKYLVCFGPQSVQTCLQYKMYADARFYPGYNSAYFDVHRTKLIIHSIQLTDFLVSICRMSSKSPNLPLI